nr:zinc finger, CCHC-type, retrotransposon Gag domain protein [Tanacetum cinerariifolium]
LVTVTWADFKKLFFLQFFPRAEQERLKKEYHSIRQTNTETSMEFMQRFLRLAGFLGAAAGTEEEQAKNFQQKSGDRNQPTSQQSSHKSHGYHNDRHGSDRRGGSDNHRSSNNNYSSSNNRLNFKSIQSSSTHEHDPN